MTEDNDRQRRIRSEEETQGDYVPPPDNAFDVNATHATPYYRPALDKDNMPLPRRVDEVDLNGTRVTPAAYAQPRRSEELPLMQDPRVAGTPLPSRPRPAQGYAEPASRPGARPYWRTRMGCFLRWAIISAFILVVAGLCASSYFVYKYYEIASALPDVADLRDRASKFETTRILDRNGQTLYEILDPNAGRRTYIPLKDISPNLVAATIATEDKSFYSHPGFDLFGIIRALWVNYQTGGQGGGASTITQQLARALLLSPEERIERTYTRKTREIILAAEITRRYSKDEILELYLNEIYYGNLAYGIEAAAETYFGKTAKDLTVGEAAFLAGLPQSPSVYDIYTNPEDTLIRQQQVLVLMYEVSTEQNCIKVSNSLTPVCVDPATAVQAAEQMKIYPYRQPSFDAKYPHWVNFIREQLEEQYDAQTIYRSGFVVYTTIDPALQDLAQSLVTEQVYSMMEERNAHNGALVAIRPSTGEILAMIGSPDFNNAEIAGQINMATSPTRQPGSSIKPFTYAAAFEKGWTPSTLIWDVPTEFPDGANPPYEPRNYDGKFHGAMTARVALVNSFNVPAVKALEFVGIYDNPDTPVKEGLIEFAKRLGVHSLTRDDYGLALTLGGGEVSLLEMTSAYAVFANGGVKVPPVAILKITDYQGNIVYEYQPQPAEQVIRAEHAYLISSILSDGEARALMFGRNSVLNLSFPAASKTGTTNDIRDNWTIGYTPDLVTGVWVGNADYTPMMASSGVTGAAPMWAKFMEFGVPYLTNGAPTPFVPPAGIMTKVVCKLSGAEPSSACGEQYAEYFASDQPPLPPGQDLARRIKLDLWTGLQASEQCKGRSEDEVVLNVKDPWAREWLDTDAGREWLEERELPAHPIYAPERECKADDPQPVIGLELSNGQEVTTLPLRVKGSAYAEEYFKGWRLEYSLTSNPDTWALLVESDAPVKNDVLFTWDYSNILNGSVNLKLTLVGKHAEVEERVTIRLNPYFTPTPAPTEIPPVPTFTPTDVPPTPTEFNLPTDTPTPTEVAPTETPTPFSG